MKEFLYAWVVINHPFNTKLISKHPKIWSSRTIVHRYFYFSSLWQCCEEMVSFLFAFCLDCDFGSVFTFIDGSQEGWNIISHEGIGTHRKRDMHDFVSIFWSDRKFFACEIFEADEFGDFSTKCCLVELECLFSITIEVDTRIDKGHDRSKVISKRSKLFKSFGCIGSAMRTSWSATGSFGTATHFFDKADDMFWPGLVLFDDRDPTDPLVTSELGEMIPLFCYFWMRFECLCHISGYFIMMWCACEEFHSY